MKEEEKIVLETDEGETLDFYVIEETKINGKDYLLVTDAEEDDEEGDCYVLKDMSAQDDPEALYQFVDDDDELDYLFGIFSNLIEDMDIDLEKK